MAGPFRQVHVGLTRSLTGKLFLQQPCEMARPVAAARIDIQTADGMLKRPIQPYTPRHRLKVAGLRHDAVDLGMQGARQPDHRDTILTAFMGLDKRQQLKIRKRLGRLLQLQLRKEHLTMEVRRQRVD